MFCFCKTKDFLNILLPQESLGTELVSFPSGTQFKGKKEGTKNISVRYKNPGKLLPLRPWLAIWQGSVARSVVYSCPPSTG